MIIDPNLRDMILFIFHHIHNLNSGSGGGNVTTSQLNTALADKVDKVAGKGLSTNDYTTADKNKINLIDSKLDKGAYNGTAQDLKNAIDILESKTVSWNDIQNKPNFNYLPLTGGTVNGNVTADSIKKKNSSDNKVLLGGGGDVELSELKNDNIKVGGRNLLKNSGEKITNKNYAIASYTLTEELKIGELLTVTIKGQLGAGKIAFALYDEIGTIEQCALFDKGGGIYQNTFNYAGHGGISNKMILTVFIYNVSTVVDSTIEWIKLERGNTATDWTPAPEDYNFIKPGFLVSELDTFKKRETGGYYVSFGGGTGILLSFQGGGSTSSLEFYKANWYPETRIQVRNTVDGSRFNDDNGGFRELAWFSDLYKPGATITGDWLAEKSYQNNIIFVQNPCNIELSELDNFGSMSFRKVFASGDITFSFHGKTIIYTSSNTFNGGEGSTATVSIFYNKCYIDIKNV
nr:MAG TPA: hypothetical protein [Caudoviricetes sp.]